MRWTRFLRRDDWGRDRARELESYLAIEIDEQVARGLSPEQARAAAQRKLGNTTRIREEIYRMNSLNWLDNIVQDIRYALRMLRQSPGFTAVAVGSLALGIGANIAIFTLVNAVLLRWLPVPNPQELVVLARNPKAPFSEFNYPDYRYIRDHSASYTGVAAYSDADNPMRFALSGSAGSAQLAVLSFVSGNYFEVLGVQPTTGRLLNPADNGREGAHPYLVLSHAFWIRMFGADPHVVGREVLLNGAKFQVIGVAREGFTGPNVGIAHDLFVPIMMFRALNPKSTDWNSRHMWWLSVVGRLRPGVSVEHARAELDVLWQQILKDEPRERPAPGDREGQIRNQAVLLDGSRGYSFLRKQAAKPLMILFATVALVLLIACANVANLLLARASGRQKEIAVRLAVGAGRGRVVAQMLTESILLSLLGGTAGLSFAWLGTRMLLPFLPRGPFPVQLDLTPDWRLLSFAVGLAVFTGVAFGLAPAFRASRPDLIPALKTDSSAAGGIRFGRWDLRRLLVSMQVALSLLLLIGAGLFTRTLSNLRGLDPGMVRENLLFISTNVGELGMKPQEERQFREGLRDEVMQLLGVRVASLAEIRPQTGSRWNNNVLVEGYIGKPNEHPSVDLNAVSPRYSETAGISLLLGRDFRGSDSLPVLPDPPPAPLLPKQQPPEPSGPPLVAVVNQAFAQKFFGGQSAIGRRFSEGKEWNPARTYEIVGVVSNARYFNLRKPVGPMIYFPVYRDPSRGGQLCVRTSGDPKQLIHMIRQKIQQLNPAVMITRADTMEDNLNRTLVQERFVATLGGFFGVVALCLAAIGLYGVMAHTVTRRTREIGIRMALGAARQRVLWLVLRDALLMVAVGVAIGGPAAVALTRYTESLLYGVTPTDPLTITLAAAVLLAVTALAGFLPARRATKVDPMVALRYE